MRRLWRRSAPRTAACRGQRRREEEEEEEQDEDVRRDGAASLRRRGRPAAPPWARLGVFLCLFFFDSRGPFLRSGQAQPGNSWVNVCTEESYQQNKLELCPPVFRVSALAFNPTISGATAEVTITLRPTMDLMSGSVRQLIYFELPGFAPVGEIDPVNPNYRLLPLAGMNPSPPNVDPRTQYNTPENTVFVSPARWDARDGMLKIEVKNEPGNNVVKANMDTEFSICCLILPLDSPLDNPRHLVSGPTDPASNPLLQIGWLPILSSSWINRGNYWDFIQIVFDPPKSLATTVISTTIRPKADLMDECRIILHLPTLTRVPDEDGIVDFVTAGTGDWILFAHEAFWTKLENILTFKLRAGATLTGGRTVTLLTRPGDFLLPEEIPNNWDGLKVEARSEDNVDLLIVATSVSQSSWVPPVRNFTHTALTFERNGSYVMTDVHFTFSTNRPLYAGKVVHLKLAGFQSDVIRVQLKGQTKWHFEEEVGIMNLPENMIELRVNKTIFCVEQNFTITMSNLILPNALYENDPSLLVWVADPGSSRQSIRHSTGFGPKKDFIRSQVKFDPMTPRMPSNVNFTILPNIVFFQGNQIVMHLFGFTCSSSKVPLVGPDAFRIHDQVGLWNAQHSTMILVVAPLQIVGIKAALQVSIPISADFRLPNKLTRNDGMLRIEGAGAASGGGAYIIKDTMKKCPKIGSTKMMLDSRIDFEPAVAGAPLALAKARIIISFITNNDILPNSTITITMGGLKRVRQPPMTPGEEAIVELQGTNAPLFINSQGAWDPLAAVLRVTMIQKVYIMAGELTRFFIEIDQHFRLPFAMYQNDPSFSISIMDAGIAERQFNYSTRVNDVDKQFEYSEFRYGTGEVPFPNTLYEIALLFRPNVDLPAGSIVRIAMPGFTCQSSDIPLKSPAVARNDESDLSLRIPRVQWDKIESILYIHVPKGAYISRNPNQKAHMRIDHPGCFRLPNQLAMNDPSLTIECIQNQIIRRTSIAMSPRVVARTFNQSEFRYSPAVKKSTFDWRIFLQPTVDIVFGQDIVMALPGFQNKLNRVNVHLTGRDRLRIMFSMAQWNATSSELTLKIPFKTSIANYTNLEFTIEESQGFILPSTLNLNETVLTIRSKSNIEPPESIKLSPMVGDGPFENHRICMFQYERGTRTQPGICRSATVIVPPLSDPCSASELDRVGCPAISTEPLPLSITGFQLYESDTVEFRPKPISCASTLPQNMQQSSFSPPSEVTATGSRGTLYYHNISSISSGEFRICVTHFGVAYDAGFLIVRPSCRSPFVLVGGTCVEHCPSMKIPIAGACTLDPVSRLQNVENQALLVAIQMNNPADIRDAIMNLTSEDARRKYFVYRFTAELSRLLDMNPKRINVVSITGTKSIIVNTVFSTVEIPGEFSATAKSAGERSPMGLVSLLRALQRDTGSMLYQSPFFSYIDRNYQPIPINVRLCPDDQYRVVCPYNYEVLPQGTTVLIFLACTGAICALVIMLCTGAWRADADDDTLRLFELEQDEKKRKEDFRSMDVVKRQEFAQSWLEGRFFCEGWQRAPRGQTKKKPLALTGGKSVAQLQDINQPPKDSMS